MSDTIRIAIIIPCYNEQDNILPLYREISSASYPARYQVVPVFINDCSTDRTKEVLQENGLAHVDLPINLGIGGAMQTGYKYALRHHFDIAVQMDGDGQHPPAELTKLVDPIINGGADVTIGSRFLTGEGFQSSALRRAGILFFKWLNKRLVGLTIHDSTSGYRALNKKALMIVNDYYPDKYPEPEAIVLYAIHGPVSYTHLPLSMGKHLFKMASDEKPLFLDFKFYFSYDQQNCKKRRGSPSRCERQHDPDGGWLRSLRNS